VVAASRRAHRSHRCWRIWSCADCRQYNVAGDHAGGAGVQLLVARLGELPPDRHRPPRAYRALDNNTAARKRLIASRFRIFSAKPRESSVKVAC